MEEGIIRNKVRIQQTHPWNDVIQIIKYIVVNIPEMYRNRNLEIYTEYSWQQDKYIKVWYWEIFYTSNYM